MAGRVTHNGIRFGGQSAEAIPDYSVVKLNASGLYELADAGEIGDGFVIEGASAANKPVTVYEFGGESPAIGGTTWAVGDLLMLANDGKLQTETDPAVPTLFTRARAAEACTVIGQKKLVRWIR